VYQGKGLAENVKSAAISAAIITNTQKNCTATLRA
jgi:hypothetical protein